MVKARAYQECCSNYKVIIMDFEMPVMNGIQVIQSLIFIFVRRQRRSDHTKGKGESTRIFSS